MIWAWLVILLVSTLSMPGDVVVQHPRQVEERVRATLPKGQRLDEALEALDDFAGLREEASAAIESFALLFEDALAERSTRKSDLRNLLEELSEERRRSWEKQLDAREQLRAAMSASEWRSVFPDPRPPADPAAGR